MLYIDRWGWIDGWMGDIYHIREKGEILHGLGQRPTFARVWASGLAEHSGNGCPFSKIRPPFPCGPSSPVNFFLLRFFCSNSKTMRPILLQGHTRSLTQIKYNKEGDLLFSVSKDKVVNVWYSHNGERLGTYNGHMGSVWTVDVNCTLFEICQNERRRARSNCFHCSNHNIADNRIRRQYCETLGSEDRTLFKDMGIQDGCKTCGIQRRRYHGIVCYRRKNGLLGLHYCFAN